MNINKKLNAQAVRETGASIEVFKSKNDNELYYKNTDNQLVNVMTDKIKAFNSYSDLPVEGVANTFYIVGEDIYMWNGTSYFSITTVPVTPSEIVEFDTEDPNLPGTVFTPDSQEASNTLYVSTDPDTVGQSWIWNTTTNLYKTYEVDIPDNTPFVLEGTSIDAGGNKVARIQRTGRVTLDGSEGSYMLRLLNNRNSGVGAGLYIFRNSGQTSGYGLRIVKGTVNQLRVEDDGSLLINDAYTLPNVDGTAGQVPTTDGAGVVTWETLNTSIPQASVIYVDSVSGVNSTGRGNINEPYLTPEYALADITNTGTITTNTATNTTLSAISDVNNASLEVGMYVSGTGIPFGTIIVAKGNEGGDANTVTLSRATTATATGVTVTWIKTYEVRMNGNFVVTSNLAKDGMYINLHNSVVYWNNFVLFSVFSTDFKTPFYILGKGNYISTGNSSRFYFETGNAYDNWYVSIDFNRIDCAGTLETLKIDQIDATVTRDINGGFINAHLGKVMSCGNGINNLKFDGYGLTGGLSTTGYNYVSRVFFTGRLETPSAVSVHGSGGVITGALVGSVSGSPVLHGGWSGNTWTGGGTINGTIGGGTVTVSSDMVINAHVSTGTITVNSGKTLIFNSFSQTTYLSLTVNDGGTFINNGYTSNSPWDNFNIAGRFVNYGKISNSKFYLNPTGILENHGTIELPIQNQGGTVINIGRWIPSANNTFHSGPGRIINRGLMVSNSTLTALSLTSTTSILENYGEISNTNALSTNPIINKGVGTLKLFPGSLIRVSNSLSPIQIGIVDSGTTTGVTSFKLIQSGQNFLTTVNVGSRIHNTTDDTWAIVTNVDSNTQLTLDTDIMVSGESYNIYGNPDVYYFNAVTNCDGTTYGLLQSFDGISPVPNDLVGGTLYENVNY